ncbi:MAG: hypothetical protein WC269_05540, partial [Candidatus Gracilibacteria bacterium]
MPTSNAIPTIAFTVWKIFSPGVIPLTKRKIVPPINTKKAKNIKTAFFIVSNGICHSPPKISLLEKISAV